MNDDFLEIDFLGRKIEISESEYDDFLDKIEPAAIEAEKRIGAMSSRVQDRIGIFDYDDVNDLEEAYDAYHDVELLRYFSVTLIRRCVRYGINMDDILGVLRLSKTKQ